MLEQRGHDGAGDREAAGNGLAQDGYGCVILPQNVNLLPSRHIHWLGSCHIGELKVHNPASLHLKLTPVPPPPPSTPCRASFPTYSGHLTLQRWATLQAYGGGNYCCRTPRTGTSSMPFMVAQAEQRQLLPGFSLSRWRMSRLYPGSECH